MTRIFGPLSPLSLCSPLIRLLLAVASCLALLSLGAPGRLSQAAPRPHAASPVPSPTLSPRPAPTLSQMLQPASRSDTAPPPPCDLGYVTGCVTPGGPPTTLGHVYAVCGSYCGPITIYWSTSAPPSWLSVTLSPTVTYTFSAWVTPVVQAAATAPVGAIGTFFTYCDARTPAGGSVGCSNAIQWSVKVVCTPTDPGCIQLKIIDVEPGSPTNGQDVSYTGASLRMVVGQHIQLAVVASNGHTVSNIQWSVPLTTPTASAPTAIKQYALPNPTTPPYTSTPPGSLHPQMLLPGDLQGSTLGFYWVQENDNYQWCWCATVPAPYWVSVSGTVDGQQAGATAQYIVSAPDVQTSCATCPDATMYAVTGQVNVDCCIGQGLHYLGLGSPILGETPGISFTEFYAQAPPNGLGEIAATQLVSATITQTTLTGRVRSCLNTGFDPTGSYWLDNYALYPRYGQGTGAAPYVSISGDGTASWSSSDTPRKTLAAPASYTVSYAFKTYMLYRPTGTDSIWVPLGVLRWSYGGTATNDGANGWSLTSATNPNPPNPGGVQTTEFPAWDHVVQNGTLLC